MPRHFEALRPWGSVYQRGSPQADVETQAFWGRGVADEAILFPAQVSWARGARFRGGGALARRPRERQRRPGGPRDGLRDAPAEAGASGAAAGPP
eukprot:1160874-Alexandrium_andersonii.AAC.1